MIFFWCPECSTRHDVPDTAQGLCLWCPCGLLLSISAEQGEVLRPPVAMVVRHPVKVEDVAKGRPDPFGECFRCGNVVPSSQLEALKTPTTAYRGDAQEEIEVTLFVCGLCMRTSARRMVESFRGRG